MPDPNMWYMNDTVQEGPTRGSTVLYSIATSPGFRPEDSA